MGHDEDMPTTTSYKKISIALGSKHEKHRWLQPACHKILEGTIVPTGDAFDTDELGTFSGEIERQGTQQETAFQKALSAIRLLNLPCGLGNEGSFGPHPLISLLACSLETLVFYDAERSFKIIENYRTLKTNYAHITSLRHQDNSSFFTQVRFPSHALILRPNVWENKSILFKGIQCYESFKKALNICCDHSADQQAFIQTDMRAHFNPTRQQQILKVGIRLFRRLSRFCPCCSAPGWGFTGVKRGKPCSACDYPTDLPTHDFWTCNICSYQEEKLRWSPAPFADPAVCPLCNP